MLSVKKVFALFLCVYMYLLTPLYANNDAYLNDESHTVRIGVLAFFSKHDTLNRWGVLADYLHRVVPQYRFVIEPLAYDELNRAVDEKKVDLVLTNSSHYIFLKERAPLSSPLATLAINENGKKATAFGGVVVVKKENNSIYTLQDLRKKRIAIIGKNSFGGYQMQAYELLEQGIDIAKEASFLIVDFPQDNIIRALKNGDIDVGFVRTGVLERMERNGEITLSDFRIIHPQPDLFFPTVLSTRLYPEWPLFSLSHVNDSLLRSIVAAIFSLQDNALAIKGLDIHSFTIPTDYSSVQTMLQALHLPPFDASPVFSLKDLWIHYSELIIAIIIISIGFLLLILFSFWRTNKALRVSNRHYDELAKQTRTMHYEVTLEGLYTYVSDSAKEILGYEPSEIAYKMYFYDLHPEHLREEVKARVFGIFATQKPFYKNESIMQTKSGEMIWIRTYGIPLLDAFGKIKGYYGSNTDITHEKRALESLQESEMRFKALHNASFGGIAIHDQGIILECNQGLSNMSGYTREELIGMNGLLLISESTRANVLKHIQEKYEKPYEAIFLHKNGTQFPIRLEGREIPYKGKMIRVVEFRDISEEKKAHEQLMLAASVFTTAREGIVIADKNEIIINVNESFSRITGYEKEEIIGKTPRVLASGIHDKAFYAALWDDLLSKDHWYGELWNRRKNGEIYVQMATISALRDGAGHISHFIALFSDITTLKEHERQLEHIAHHDALTSLPNRLLLSDRLHQGMANAKRHEKMLVVAYLDLDGFKSVNDAYGHEVGDELLIALSKQMKEALREGDTLSRIGGDEFVAIFNDVADVPSTIPLLLRLLNATSKPVTLGNFILQVSASVGATFYPQKEHIEADQLLRQADQAMYQAKLAGKNRYHLFDSQQDSHIRSHHESLEHIRMALRKNEFVLYYQPKVQMKTGELIGVEALIRWNHPEKGILSPAHFLPIIEDNPLGAELDRWVIKKALWQIDTWEKMGLSIPISVNVGARILQEGDFVEFLRSLLSEYPLLNPHDLELEVLETSALEDLSLVSKVMKECSKLGIFFALDDFGTGYSSLTYLKQLPVRMLKIDQSFVRDMLEDPDDLTILKGIIGLAKAFHKEVIAEGVESILHGEKLIELGCLLAQGYGIAKPMPPENLLTWKQTWKPSPSWT